MRLALALALAIPVLAPLSGVSCAAAAKSSKDPLASGALRATAVGRYDFESADSRVDAPDPTADPTVAPEELSGLVRIEGDRYLAIGDAHATVHALTITVDPRTGAVRKASFGAPILLRDIPGSRLPEPAMAEDREGIAYDPVKKEVLIANEQTGADKRWPSIERYGMDGKTVAVLRVDSDPALAPFLHMRPNRGFESLTRSEDGSYWTANEDALLVDGPAASDTAGAEVRLLRLDADLHPGAQFVYPLDPWSRKIRNPSIVSGKEISGLSELVALPGGRLLALERAFGGDIGGNASLRSRLYVVDLAGATDVSTPEYRDGLAGKRYRPARKTLLWEEGWGLTDSNFEGMALGPELTDGSRLLLLIADNNGGSAQALFTLRLRKR
ncbi:MAG TPA: esterase-like activity of phytase family protein [Candidatus Omnitrophota bacterium]|nr:esterase-like activity of phytase family protein [Candidatus Omnitrophota bacterium]